MSAGKHTHVTVTRLAVAVLMLSIVAPWPASSAVATTNQQAVDEAVDADETVQRARAALDDAAAVRASTAQRLDEAAADYEAAWAQAQRLASESQQDWSTFEALDKSLDRSRTETRDRAIAAYLEPSRQLSMTGLVLSARDASTALHMAGLIQHMGRRSDQSLARLDRTEARRYDETRQLGVVAAGTQSVADQQRLAAARLQSSLAEATEVVRTAERTVAEVEQQVAEQERERQRREAERRAREEAARLAQVRAGSGPPPAVNGRACPIGGPNGFIDSWGFPRSGGRSHKGVDIFAPQGTAQFAVADGTVDTGSNRLGGLTIWLTDNDGNRYYYAHLASIKVTDGAQVKAGQVIGTTGTTGNAAGTPPHLHWQYHPGGGSAVNPYPLASVLCR